VLLRVLPPVQYLVYSINAAVHRLVLIADLEFADGFIDVVYGSSVFYGVYHVSVRPLYVLTPPVVNVMSIFQYDENKTRS
jgi:hypothetical protein